jgi:hypothetical protein
MTHHSYQKSFPKEPIPLEYGCWGAAQCYALQFYSETYPHQDPIQRQSLGRYASLEIL